MLVARQDAPVTVVSKTRTELQVLEPHAFKAGAAIEYAQATDLESGPRGIAPREERVFILCNRGEY